MDSSYNVIDEEIYQAYLDDKKNNSEKTIKEYTKTLNKFCKAIGKPISEIVEEIKQEQSTTIEEIISKDENKTVKRITDFDVNSPKSTIKKYHKQFESYCLDKGNNNNTTNKEIKRVRTFFNANDIKLPKWEFLDETPPDWELLEKEDIKFVLDECSIIHKTLILFMLSSGMRIGDCVKLTIGNFMDATRAYHDFVDVEDFIDNAPQDMMGFWSFEPGKTNRYDISCKTFNSPESSNLILQNLRRLKNEYLPRKSKRLKKDLKMSKHDALFGSRNSLYKGKMNPDSISTLFPTKNKKLKEYRINKIKKAIEEGKISEEDYEMEINKIPKFHAHACRKYFETMIARNCGDLRICTLMEGHASPVKTDKSYIKKEFEDVQEIYLQALEDLTIEKIDSKLLSNKKISELESTIKDLKSDQEKKDKIIQQQDEQIKTLEIQANSSETKQQELEENITELSDRLKIMGKHLKHLDDDKPLDAEIKSSIFGDIAYLSDENNFNWMEEEELEETLNEYDGIIEQLLSFNKEEILTIQEIAYEIATKEVQFDGTRQTLNPIIKKAIFRLKTNPDLVIKVENYYEDLNYKWEKQSEIRKLLYKKINELNLWEENEKEEICEKIFTYIYKNNLLYTIDEDNILELLEKYYIGEL